MLLSCGSGIGSYKKRRLPLSVARSHLEPFAVTATATSMFESAARAPIDVSPANDAMKRAKALLRRF